jgi:hypothetical protein
MERLRPKAVINKRSGAVDITMVQAGRRTKYNNTRVVVDGYKFDSKREATRYGVLKMLAMAGEITELEVHPEYDLTTNGVSVCKYEADFSYLRNEKRVVEDVKGVRTPVYKIKKKLMRAIYNIDILET